MCVCVCVCVRVRVCVCSCMFKKVQLFIINLQECMYNINTGYFLTYNFRLSILFKFSYAIHSILRFLNNDLSPKKGSISK